MITATQLKKNFKEVQAVKSISLRAEDGKITGLLGENGAGKTTTIRMLAGSIQADQGEVRVDGEVFAGLNPNIQRRIGILSEKAGLYQRLTARENIYFFGQMMGLSASELSSRTDQLIRILDMKDIADRQTTGFSTGQKVKVSLARILVYQPKNILLDEPTSGLDVLAKRTLRDMIRRLRDEGYCLIFSSHIMEEVEQLCDEVYMVHEGRSVGNGSVAELMQQAGASRFEDVFVATISGGLHV